MQKKIVWALRNDNFSRIDSDELIYKISTMAYERTSMSKFLLKISILISKCSQQMDDFQANEADIVYLLTYH